METVNRILQEKITARIAPNKAVLIFGARRVGKTVMMRKIVDNYSGRTMMLNGEDYDRGTGYFLLVRWSSYPSTVNTLNMKKETSLTPLKSALKILIFEFKDSADALVSLLMK